MLEVTRQLARTLELDELLPRLLDHLLGLFPQAERGLILTREGRRTRSARSRGGGRRAGQPETYSRSVVRRVLEEGVGVLADRRPGRAHASPRPTPSPPSACAPPVRPSYRGTAAGRSGVVQLDRFGMGTPFTPDDLHLLAAVSLPVSVVLENAALHAGCRERAHRARLGTGPPRPARGRRRPRGQQPAAPSSATTSPSSAATCRPWATCCDCTREAERRLAEGAPEVLAPSAGLAEEIDLTCDRAPNWPSC